MSYLQEAIELLQTKKKTNKLSPKAQAVYPYVKDRLIDFCGQDDEFAQAIAQSGKSCEDCCESIMGRVGSSISDLDVYKKAVSFYFPGATVQMTLHIDLCPQANLQPDADLQTKQAIVLDLKDFL